MNRSARRRRTLAFLALTLALGLAACAAIEAAPGVSSGIVDPPDLGDPRTSENGHVPANEPVSPFDEHLPTIANLQPDLLAALQAAATAAAEDGVPMVVTSGWRSARYQQVLLDEATIRYGSLEEARKWVNTPELSLHVTGNAVDVGYTDANSWLSQHGADYGLCQTYANEMWHFELATEPGGTCPPQLTDAAG